MVTVLVGNKALYSHSPDSSPGPFPAESSRENRKRDLAEGQNLFTPYMYSALSSEHHACTCAWGEEGCCEEAQGKLPISRAMSLEVEKKIGQWTRKSWLT